MPIAAKSDIKGITKTVMSPVLAKLALELKLYIDAAIAAIDTGGTPVAITKTTDNSQEQTLIQTHNDTGDGNSTTIDMLSTATETKITISNSFNDGEKQGKIELDTIQNITVLETNADILNVNGAAGTGTCQTNFNGEVNILTGNLSILQNGGFVDLRSPDGTLWRISVDNSGVLTVTPD